MKWLKKHEDAGLNGVRPPDDRSDPLDVGRILAHLSDSSHRLDALRNLAEGPAGLNQDAGVTTDPLDLAAPG
ncbi:hypothetical protein JOD57_003891 [Geodermatophilus bullaregiensis]|nr:hypothetical protein [Geodermatophilus bullaregiensis]MBM7808054.1 hypothetical protein [Geodermatophilus bullaregiensis]